MKIPRAAAACRTAFFTTGFSLMTRSRSDPIGTPHAVAVRVLDLAPPGRIASGILLLVARLFTDLVRNLPQPVLAAIVLMAVASLVKVRELQRLWQVHRGEFLVAATALLGVLWRSCPPRRRRGSACGPSSVAKGLLAGRRGTWYRRRLEGRVRGSVSDLRRG